MELRPLVQFDFPAKINIEKKINDVKEEKKWDTDFVIFGGAEMLFAAEFSPIHYGFGLGYKTPQKHDGLQASPAAIPFWANLSFGAFNKERLFSPYVVARLGSLAPLTTNSNWWERPLNFFVEGGAGVIMPYGIGLEVNYDYSSMQKSFNNKKASFRVSSGRVGIQLSVGFELTHDRTYKTNEEQQAAKAAETKQSAPDTSNYSYVPPSEAFSYGYNEEDVTDEDSASTTDASTVTDTETPAEDSAATVPAPEIEEPAAEPAAEAEPEAVAEPEPEPEVAPVEEPKPAAKKASKKSSKKAKKASKKSTKKSSKKNKKKK